MFCFTKHQMFCKVQDAYHQSISVINICHHHHHHHHPQQCMPGNRGAGVKITRWKLESKVGRIRKFKLTLTYRGFIEVRALGKLRLSHQFARVFFHKKNLSGFDFVNNDWFCITALLRYTIGLKPRATFSSNDPIRSK